MYKGGYQIIDLRQYLLDLSKTENTILVEDEKNLSIAKSLYEQIVTKPIICLIKDTNENEYIGEMDVFLDREDRLLYLNKHFVFGSIDFNVRCEIAVENEVVNFEILFTVESEEIGE